MSDLMARLDDLVPFMVSELPDCDDGYILNALRKAARLFCIETEAWRKEADPISIVAGTVRYKLVTKEEASIHRIVKVMIDDVEQDIRLVSLSADGRYIELDESIEPQDAIADGMVVTVVLRPFMTANAYGEWFLDRHAEGIMAGTFASLMLEPKKPWSDAAKGMYYQGVYTQKKAEARRENDANHTSADVVMDFQTFI